MNQLARIFQDDFSIAGCFSRIMKYGTCGYFAGMPENIHYGYKWGSQYLNLTNQPGDSPVPTREYYFNGASRHKRCPEEFPLLKELKKLGLPSQFHNNKK